MKRTIIEVILVLSLIGASIFAFLKYKEVTGLKENIKELEQIAKENENLRAQVDESNASIKGILAKAKMYDAAKVSLSSGIALTDMKLAAENSETVNPDRLLSSGAIRMLIYGSSDQKAIAFFQKALDLVDLSSKLKSVCAAQAGISASGKKISILSECEKLVKK